MNTTVATVRTITRWIAAAAAVWAMAVLCGQLPVAAAGAAEPRADDALPRSVAPRGPATLADLVEQGRGNSGIPDAAGDGPFAPPAAGPRQPIPPVDQLTAAGRLLEEVFGKRLAAAKTPADKGKLAREIIEAVRNEPDAAARYAAWSQARILAVEARDGRLALSAVRLLAGQFESDAGPATDGERLARADRLWTEADKAEGKTRLDRQLAAAEEILRAGPLTGLIARKWEMRLNTIGNGDAIILAAKDAKLVGARLNIRNDATSGWIDPSEYVEWPCTLKQGEYRVSIVYSSRGVLGGYLLAISLLQNGRAVGAMPIDVPTTGDWNDYREKDVGTLTVKRDGGYIVRFHVVRKVRHDTEPGIINLRSISLAQ